MERLVGIIIRRIKYRENIFFSFLTSRGILKIVAKGVVKPKAKLRGVIELFDVPRLELIKGKANYILVGGKLIRRPLYLRRNLEKSLFLMVMSEISLAIVKGEDTNNVFHFWLLLLKKLKEIDLKYLTQFFAFSLVHLLFLEGLIDKNSGRIFKMKSQFLMDLTNLSFLGLLAKNYSKINYLVFIKAAKRWLQSEGIKFLTFDLFLGKIDKL